LYNGTFVTRITDPISVSVRLLVTSRCLAHAARPTPVRSFADQPRAMCRGKSERPPLQAKRRKAQVASLANAVLSHTVNMQSAWDMPDCCLSGSTPSATRPPR
jgi:hypothetical protein